jgi:hypothetical protein
MCGLGESATLLSDIFLELKVRTWSSCDFFAEFALFAVAKELLEIDK